MLDLQETARQEMLDLEKRALQKMSDLEKRAQQARERAQQALEESQRVQQELDQYRLSLQQDSNLWNKNLNNQSQTFGSPVSPVPLVDRCITYLREAYASYAPANPDDEFIEHEQVLPTLRILTFGLAGGSVPYFELNRVQNKVMVRCCLARRDAYMGYAIRSGSFLVVTCQPCQVVRDAQRRRDLRKERNKRRTSPTSHVPLSAMSPEALQLKSQESHKRRRLIQRQKRQLEFKARASLSLDRKTNEGVLRDIQKALKCCKSESQSFKAEIIKTLVEMEESYCDVTDKSTEDDKDVEMCRSQTRLTQAAESTCSFVQYTE